MGSGKGQAKRVKTISHPKHRAGPSEKVKEYQPMRKYGIKSGYHYWTIIDTETKENVQSFSAKQYGGDQKTREAARREVARLNKEYEEKMFEENRLEEEKNAAAQRNKEKIKNSVKKDVNF